MQENSEKKESEKWDFSDYAFTITGIIVGVLLVVPSLVEEWFGISVFTWSLRGNELRFFSPFLFLLTTTIVMIKDACDVRKKGGYTGSIFTHTFESTFEDATYMAITTIIVYSSLLRGTMYSSWLAGPITWILFIFIFPLVRKERNDEVRKPWLLLFVFAVGIVAEVLTGAWVAFPLAWLIICVVKFIDTIRVRPQTVDTVFDWIYYAFSVVLMAAGIFLGLWIVSWLAFPIALFICWVLSKHRRFKKRAG